MAVPEQIRVVSSHRAPVFDRAVEKYEVNDYLRSQCRGDLSPYHALLLFSNHPVFNRPWISDILPSRVPGQPRHHQPARKEEGYCEGNEYAEDEDYTCD